MGVYKRDDVWWIDYYVGGQRKREAVGPKKKEAEAALGKILGLIREGRYFDAKRIKPITFDDMAAKFSEWLASNRKSADYLYTLPPATECFKGRLLTGITEHEIETYRAMRRDVPTVAGKPRTIRRSIMNSPS